MGCRFSGATPAGPVVTTIAKNGGATSHPAAVLQVRDIGSFHVGGHMASLTGMPPRARVSTAQGATHPIDPNGEMIVGQMYVKYVKLADPGSRYPLLLWHGGGMSGVNWETTPDGRPGWRMFFLRAGFDVLVSDAVERGSVVLGAISRRLFGCTVFPHGTRGMGRNLPLRSG
jgi:hypothetical protein